MNFLTNKLKVNEKDLPLLKKVYFAFFTSGFMCTLFGAILPFMKAEYNMSYVLSGLVLSAHQVGNLCAVLIAGFLPYAIGRKKSTVFLSTGIVIGFTIICITGNPLALIIAFALAGVSKGTLSNISNVVVSDVTENKTAGLNILHATFAVGAFISPFIAIFCTKYTPLSWRGGAIILIELEIIAIVGFIFSNLSNTHTAKVKDTNRLFITSPSFWLNTSILFFYLCCESSVVGWLVTYFKESGIFGPFLAQSSASFLWIMMMVGRLVCALISTKVNKNKLLVSLALIQVVFFFIMISSSQLPLILIGLVGVGLGMSGMYPTTLGTMDPRYNSSTVATGTCIAVATLGAVIMPSIVGVVAQNRGLAGGVSVIGVAYAMMLLLSVIKLLCERKVQ